MGAAPDANSVAEIWRQAAIAVRELRRADAAADATPWNDAIGRAAQTLERESENIRAMGWMAHLLIVGNTGPATGTAPPESRGHLG